MLFFFVYVLIHFLREPPHSYLAWRGWVRNPAVSITIFVFFATLSVHAWVGIRDVVMDYVRPVTLRVAVLTVLGVSLFAIQIWVMQILLKGRE
jgi:succinate dehydrogenase / fumarate reductase, membrane anchor subunit